MFLLFLLRGTEEGRYQNKVHISVHVKRASDEAKDDKTNDVFSFCISECHAC